MPISEGNRTALRRAFNANLQAIMRFLTAQPYCVYFNGPLEPGGRGGAMPSNYFDIIKTPMDYAKINDKLVSVRVEKERARVRKTRGAKGEVN